MNIPGAGIYKQNQRKEEKKLPNEKWTKSVTEQCKKSASKAAWCGEIIEQNGNKARSEQAVVSYRKIKMSVTENGRIPLHKSAEFGNTICSYIVSLLITLPSTFIEEIGSAGIFLFSFAHVHAICHEWFEELSLIRFFYYSCSSPSSCKYTLRFPNCSSSLLSRRR